MKAIWFVPEDILISMANSKYIDIENNVSDLAILIELSDNMLILALILRILSIILYKYCNFYIHVLYY